MALPRPHSKKRQAVALGIGALVLGLIAFMVLNRPRDANFGVRRVVRLPGDELLLVERAGFDNNTYDRGRLRVIGFDGVEHRRSEAVEMALTLYAVVDGGIWIGSHAGGPELWGFAELAPRPGAGAAIAGEPMLARRHDVAGVAGDALVLRGGDDRYYTISTSYTIERQPKEFHPEPLSTPELTSVSPGAKYHDGTLEPFAIDDAPLFDAGPLLGEGMPLRVGADAVLVHSFDRDGDGRTGIVSLVQRGGAVRWSVRLRDQMQPCELGDRGNYNAIFAELDGEVVRLVTQADVFHAQSTYADGRTSRAWGEYQLWIVELDVSDGGARSHEVVRPDV